MYQSSRCKVNFQDLFALLLTVRRSVLKVGRYKKWQKLTQDMPFSFSTKPTNQVFLLLEMYPDTSAYILKNPFFFFLIPIRVHFPYYGSPIVVSCEMFGALTRLSLSSSYTYSSEVTRKQAQNMTSLLTKFVPFFKATLYPSIHYRFQPHCRELVCQTFMPFVLLQLYYNF